MAAPEDRGGRGGGGSGEAQTQGQPRDSAMAPVQPSLGPPRDEPRVFGLDKFNGDKFAERSFRMENIFDHYDLLEVMEGTEKHPENDPEKSPGDPLFPFSPLWLLLLLSTSLALKRSELRLPLVGDTATAGARGARVVKGAAGEAVAEVEEAEEVAVEVVLGAGASVAVVEVVAAVAEVVEAAAEVVEVAVAVVLVKVQPRNVEALVAASASSSCALVRPRRSSSFVSGTLGVGGLGFTDAVELPRWHDLLLQNVPIFDLDFDAILAAMYAIADSAEGDYSLSVPPNPGIAAAALGASASAAPGT
ncbi:unnamed protein product, partial [Closterium sp. NIES-53]